MKNATQSGIELYTAEYATTNNFQDFILRKLGLSFSFDEIPHKKIYMLYSSMPVFDEKMRIHVNELRNRQGNKIEVALGVIDVGILGNEPILSSEELEKDLKYCRESGFNDVTIFRLGGINQDYLDVIKKFARD